MSEEELIEAASKAIADAQNVPFVGVKQRKLARAVLAVFEQAQAEPEWEYGLCEEDPRERPHRAYNGAHLVSDNRAYVEAQHRRGHPSIKFVRRRKAGPWGSVDVSDE